MKKIVSLCLIVTIIITSFIQYSFAGESRNNFFIEYDGQTFRYTSRVVTLNIDGKEVQTGAMPAVILDGRTLVPAREVFESDAIKASVQWNGTNQEVYITYLDKNIVLKIGSTTALVNNEPVELDVPAKLIRDTSQDYSKTMIPLRFVTEKLGFDVEWDSKTYTAMITNPNGDSGMPDDEEDLDELNADGAKRELPTALKDNPVIWNATADSQAEDLVLSEEIITEQHDETKITSIDYVEEDGRRIFKIKANGPITSADSSVWDGKYIIDIHNALYDLDKEYTTYKLTYSDNPIALAVRSSQQEVDENGKAVVRVVFDLKNPNSDYIFTLSPDRTTLMLEMKEEQLTTIELGQNDKGDYIKLTGTVAPFVEAFRLSDPDRIVFDLPGMHSLIGYQEQEDIEGQYIVSLRTAQFETNTARVVVETDGQADYTILELDDYTTMIQFLEPSYDNIVYQNDTQPIITLEGAAGKINMEGITYEDKYYDRQYIIHLSDDYSELLGQGDINVQDDIIESIEIKTNAEGNTDLVIKEKEIYEFRIESDDENVYIKAYKPKELYSKIIVVDFGHGGKDPGAISASGIFEKDLNLAIGNYLKGYLDGNDSIKVYYTRRDDTYISLQERCDIANQVEADLLLSIHNNSFMSSFTGTETIYFKDEDHPGLNSVELAKIMQEKVVGALGLTDRGIKENNTLFVLRNSNMAAVIVEVGFVSNAVDITKISDPAIQDKVAKALYEGILKVFESYPTRR